MMNTYSFANVFVTIGGQILYGLDKIQVTYSSDVFEPIKGVRGHHTRRKTSDRSSIVEITTLQTSFANDVLCSLLEYDKNTNNGRTSVMINDTNGRSLFSSNSAYIVGYPDTEYAEEIGERVWKIHCMNTDVMYVGGNTVPDKVAQVQSAEKKGFSLDQIGQIARDAAKVGSFVKKAKSIFN